MRFFRVLLVAFGLAAAGAAPAAAGGRPSPEALRYFTPEEIERGARHARQSRWLWLGSLAWTILILLALAHPRVGKLFIAAASRLTGVGDAAGGWKVHAAAALAVAMLMGAYILLRMPFAWARGYFFEHAWGLSTQGPGAFLLDWVKSAVLATLLYTVVLGAIVILRARLPAYWPLAAWGAVSTFTVLMVFLHPILIDPLFNTFTPVREPEVRERAESVAKRAGVRIGDVLWVDASRRTRRTNAYFTGLGGTKRIVLYDTLRGDGGEMSQENIEEIETIVAHEAGHWRHGHMWKGTALGVAGMGAFFLALWMLSYVKSGWVPEAALPGGARAVVGVFFAATVLNLLAMPAANAVSRSWERAADRASLELSGTPAAFVRAEVELARKNISEIEPGALAVFWLYTHPPVLERIRMAEDYVPPSQPRPLTGEATQ